MTIIVTGGAGFIGSAVCRHFVGLGRRVVNIDKMTYAATLGSTQMLAGHPRYRHVKIDVCDPAALAACFAEHKPEAVIHLAAESHVDRSITGPADFVSTNILGAFQILTASKFYWEGLGAEAARAFRVIHVSTDEVYGSLGSTGLFSEETAYAPNSPYSASKASSDHLARAWFHTYGLPVIVSNCSNNYGPYQFPEKLIPLTILNGYEGRPLPVYGSGANVRDWLHVDDHVAAIHAILARGSPGQNYNIGSRNERTNLQVVRLVCELLDAAAPSQAPHGDLIRFVTDRPGHDQRYAIDPSKLEREIGWRSKHTFEDGLKQTVDWYLAHEDWWGPLRQGSGDQRLGLPARVAGRGPHDQLA